MMPGTTAISAGLLLFRTDKGLEVFLVHPGGPFWKTAISGPGRFPKAKLLPAKNLSPLPSVSSKKK
jgi:predicted NUDIX family NTP pyrophosphohydrolase